MGVEPWVQGVLIGTSSVGSGWTRDAFLGRPAWASMRALAYR